MKDESKTKEQLLSELAELRQRIAELEKAETERKGTEEALRESEERFRNIIQSLPMGVHTYQLEPDGQLRFIGANPAADEILGVDNTQYIGKTIEEAFPAIVETEIPERFRTIAQKGGFWKKEDIVYEDELIGGVFENYNFQTSRGKMASLFIEITERKRAEEALQESLERLEEIVEQRTKELQDAQEELVRQERLAVLGQLAGGVGHELRNPLGVISNAVYYLQTILPDADETTKEYLEMIASEVRTSEKIVSDLLDLSRTRAGEREEIAVSDLATQVLERQPPPEKVKVTSKIPSNLPPLFVDSQQIGQVLVNLVTNAYQAMPEGGRLTVKANHKKGQVHLSVTDTGCGIPRENMEKLFEPLFTTKARGIGLGLAVSKNLVEANGGSIEVVSEEGKGSTFTVRLPIRGKEEK